jgi:hypothetical protein
MKKALLLSVLLAVQAFSLDGDVRTRLWRRFPSCRGTIEGAYAGDEMSFFHRIRFDAGKWDFTLMLDKSRGEEWVDIVAGGVSFIPDSGWAGPLSLGWLEADLGSGLVFSHPGSWSAPSELSAYKPPVIRDIVRTASSPGDCRGDPLTGACFSMTAAGLNLSMLAGVSWKDASGDGHHRTLSEIEARGSIRETLGAIRVSNGWWGATAAAGTEREPDGQPGWGRCGVDWDVGFPAFRLTGETAAGVDSSGVSVAWWAAASLESDRYRQTLTAMGEPEEFPSERSSAPMERAGNGLLYGFRWAVVPRLTLTGGAGAWLKEGEETFRASTETAYRFPFSMESAVGVRFSREQDSVDWRGWLSCSWQPVEEAGLGMKIQLTGADPGEQEAAASGGGLGLTVKWEPAAWLSARLLGAGFDTDGYSSRIYYGEPTFPGEFGSTALWGRGFLMGGSVSAELGEGAFLRARLSRLVVENMESLGSGWEETEGGSRTEFGLQLDWAFP